MLVFAQLLARQGDFVAGVGRYSPIIRVLGIWISIHRFATRAVESGDRQLHGADTAFQLEKASHDALPERPLTDDDGPLMVLQTGGDNFSGRSGLAIHKKRHRDG